MSSHWGHLPALLPFMGDTGSARNLTVAKPRCGSPRSPLGGASASSAVRAGPRAGECHFLGTQTSILCLWGRCHSLVSLWSEVTDPVVLPSSVKLAELPECGKDAGVASERAAAPATRASCAAVQRPCPGHCDRERFHREPTGCARSVRVRSRGARRSSAAQTPLGWVLLRSSTSSSSPAPYPRRTQSGADQELTVSCDSVPGRREWAPRPALGKDPR